MRNTIRKSRVERPLGKLRHLKPTIDKGETGKKKGGGGVNTQAQRRCIPEKL